MVTVSVVVPFLNAGRYLPEAIASLQNQTCHDWEMVLIDDGSTDGSAGIVARAASADPRIRLLRRPFGAPGSAAAARNLGILDAYGEFVAFLDADDVYEPNNLQSRLQAFEAHPEVMMVYGPTRWWHPGAERRDWIEGMRREAGRVHDPPQLLNRVVLMQLGHVPCTCGVMIRRRALALTGGFDSKSRGLRSDPPAPGADSFPHLGTGLCEKHRSGGHLGGTSSATGVRALREQSGDARSGGAAYARSTQHGKESPRVFEWRSQTSAEPSLRLVSQLGYSARC
jgi:glycosyltransferase involved in cell wall biosynthesis